MTQFILPSVIGLTAIGIGFALSLSSQAREPGALPVLIQISHPIGTPASEAMVMAHPVMPAVEMERSVRVVLSSPYVPRGSR